MLINNLQAHIALSRSIIDTAIARVLDRAWLVLGPEVKEFESAFAAYVGVSHCVSVANGTDALELALRAADVKQGDLVATVANAGMYTTLAMRAAGARPFFMDVSAENMLVDKREVTRAIAAGVKAVVITHLYGLAVPQIQSMVESCRAAGIKIIEDCAQAHGAEIEGRKVGAFGDMACFSFYPTKNLGALGDGGAIVSNDDDLASTASKLRQYGWSSKYNVELPGARNSRLDELQAAILLDFLPLLDSWNEKRRHVARAYGEGIKHPSVELPRAFTKNYVAHLYVIKTKERESLRNHLQQKGICSDIHYPVPDHRQPILQGETDLVPLPQTEQLAGEILTLPCYPEMTDEEVAQVIDAVNTWPHPQT
ncbi:DegT/DnrJ/EryC1/StrS family aminotransferase [uncultured Herbaspirillum sp.]|uniref:DegT/DnrJ/EryC1/StrS family aminotransferase n=1 Tax=uncultured Herbaspirillum sp. TaxID=160236 RepID=UPI002582E230|nr:DegT/DnrJ/EryC1/StrS family aminotransferase [uncultured Herbaspirillum sp.]